MNAHDAAEDAHNAAEDVHDATEDTDSDSMSSSKWTDLPDDPLEPMQEPGTAPWDLSISDTDFEKLTAGFKPRYMEDRWAWDVDGPDPDGNISVQIVQWSIPKAAYVLHLKRGENGSAKIDSITWEQNMKGIMVSEEQAKMEIVYKCRAQLHCDFEGLPKYTWTEDSGVTISDSA
ncbi:hypothetical protein MAPG_05236 [Magnaporthiopsis poae ATCC 64411]|uniref:Uncharacterized protein n=1 Tax=Magnaporthiopsis poae (strain ATCC 64411 / 73-15) TaxID=644358 RepID=A0A0C4DYV7_MAGP6|nr:hypothetical protein MAPG_05236 [Magnaporthiopsis poae ATCC 64411]